MQWISEKESIGPNKLKRKFLDEIHTEYIPISGFKSSRSVSTFRALKLGKSHENAVKSLLYTDRATSKQNHNGNRDQFASSSNKDDAKYNDHLDVEKSGHTKKISKV